MQAKEVAKLTGISVRTLHYYDDIGLLSPKRDVINGYRQYSHGDLDMLQQILFFKACGFPLDKIQKLCGSPSFDREQAFLLQEKYLLHERERINAMLGTLHKTLRAMKGEITMTQKEKFGGFDMANNPYEEEARKLWGDEAVDKSNAHIKALSKDGQDAIAKGMDSLFQGLAQLRHESPASAKAQAAMERMYQYFNTNFGGQYSPEAFAGVGQLYATDARFTENVDQYGAGLSQFLAEAMGLYAKSKKQ